MYEKVTWTLALTWPRAKNSRANGRNLRRRSPFRSKRLAKPCSQTGRCLPRLNNSSQSRLRTSPNLRTAFAATRKQRSRTAPRCRICWKQFGSPQKCAGGAYTHANFALLARQDRLRLYLIPKRLWAEAVNEEIDERAYLAGEMAVREVDRVDSALHGEVLRKHLL